MWSFCAWLAGRIGYCTLRSAGQFVGVESSDFAASRAFYAAVLKPLGIGLAWVPEDVSCIHSAGPFVLKIGRIAEGGE
jgi:hypothetical protein